MADLVYSPTTWNHGAAPAIDADKLNNIEQGIVQVTNASNAAPETVITEAFLMMGS